MDERISRVLEKMKEKGIDQLLVSDPLSIRFLTGIMVNPGERLYALLLRTSGKHTLFLNYLYYVSNTGFEEVWFSDMDDQIGVLMEHIDTKSTLGIDKTWPARFLIPLQERCPEMKTIWGSDCVDGVRAVKNEEEIAIMKYIGAKDGFVRAPFIIEGILIGLVVALVRLGAAKKGRRTILSTIADIYVDVIRGTPSVLQLMIIYFAVFHSRLGYVAAVVSFGINSGAYVSEVIRGGILSVDKGQSEAGRSLGLGYKDTMRFIIIPQAVKTILPAMGNEFIQLIKETSILGYVGIMDLTKAASYVSSRTYQMFIPLIVAGIMYYLIVKCLSLLLKRFERRLRESD